MGRTPTSRLALTLARKRRDLDLTQATLADRVGVTYHEVGRWERGQVVPSDDNLRPLARTLGVPVAELRALAAAARRRRANGS
jgi:transcriptional regulator with XRE-family HTH domain